MVVFADRGAADSLYTVNDMTISGTTRKSDGKTIKSKTVTQNYNLGFSKTLTNTIKLSGDLRTSKNKTDSVKTNSFDPTVFLYMTNEYFNSNIGYQMSDRLLSTGDSIVSKSKNLTFSTAPSGFPSLSLNYNGTRTKDDLSDHDTNGKQSYFNGSTGYGLYGVNTQYNYSKSESENFVSKTKQETPTHFGSIRYHSNFFQDRLSLNLDSGMTKTKTINTSLSDDPVDIPVERNIVMGLYEIDSLPADGTLPDYPSLINDNTASDSGTGINLNGEYRNMGVKLQNSEEVNVIYLYITPESSQGQNISTMGFAWDVYYSTEISGDIWRTVTLASSDFNETTNRFEMIFSQSTEALFFKVVNRVSPLANTITVTEIEVLGFITIASSEENKLKSTTDRYYWGTNLGYKITEKVGASYSFNFDKSEQKSEQPSTKSINKNINHGLSLSYAMSRYASLSSSYQNQRSLSSSSDDVGSDIYMISINTNPFKTINASLVLNHSDAFINSDVTSKSNSGSLNSFFNLYPGIDLGTGFTVNRTKNLMSDSKTSANSFNSNLTLKPRKSIRILIDTILTKSSAESAGEKTNVFTKNMRTTISLNPSRYISMNATLQHFPESKKDFSVNTNFPGTLQLRLNYSRSDTGSDSIRSTAYWNISRYIYISPNYSLTRANDGTGDRFSSYSLSVSLRK